MMRKFLTASVLSAAFFLAAPAAANPFDPFDQCYFHNGCFWSESQSRWICNDDNVYALCLSPDLGEGLR